MTIKHIVMWHLHDYAAGADRIENRERMKTQLLTCANLVSGMLRFEVATANEQREGLEAGCDVILYSEFTDLAALEAYQNHPGHLAIKEFVAEVRKTRHCMDYEH